MKALFTMLILLGTSSVALATPMLRDQRSDYDRYNDNDRYDRDHDQRSDHRFSWRRPVMLASNISLMRQWNREQRPMLVNIDQRVGGLKRLRLAHDDGRMRVDSVIIRFADGHQQSVRIDQMLSARQPSIQIDLDHGNVTSMYVYGQAMRGRATFDVIGLRR